MLTRMAIAIASGTFAVLALGSCYARHVVATAEPPKFPDLNAFQPVDPAPYTMQFGRGGGGVFFATPDGLQCGWGSLANGPADHVSAECDGPLPVCQIPLPVDKMAVKGWGWQALCTRIWVPTVSFKAPARSSQHRC